jgi:hypothetical protein
MWYQAWPEQWLKGDVSWGGDVAAVGYAESEDGITWRKPILNQIEYNGSTRNNLINLSVHTPSLLSDQNPL